MKKSVIKSAKTSDEAIRLALDEIGKEKDQVSIEVLEEASSGFLGLIGGKDAVVRVSYEEDIKEVLEDLKSEIEVESFRNDIKDYDVKERSDHFKKEADLPADDVKVEDQKEDTISEKIKDGIEDIKEDVTEKSEDIKEKIEDLIDKDEDPKEDQADYALSKKRSNIDSYYKAKNLLEDILEAMHFENVSVIGNLEGTIIKLEAKVEENDTGMAIGKQGSTLDSIEFIIRKAIDSRANNLRVNVDINNYKKRRDEKIVRLARDTAEKVARSQKSWNLRYMNSYERRLAHEEISKHPNVESHSEGREPQRYVVVDYVGEDL